MKRSVQQKSVHRMFRPDHGHEEDCQCLLARKLDKIALQLLNEVEPLVEDALNYNTLPNGFISLEVRDTIKRHFKRVREGG